MNYLEDESITVDVWPNSGLETITKQDVINMSLSSDLYSPKTSKHTIQNDLPPIHVTLDILMKEE